MNKKLRTVAIIILMIIFTVLAVGCNPNPVETRTKTDTETNMVFVGRIDEVQVWKFIDGMTVCYVTVNANRYEAAGIFCK